MDVSTPRALIAAAIDQAVTPAAVVEVGRTTAPLWREPFGQLTYDADATPTNLETMFDLASLTKVMATTSLSMRALVDRCIDLETPISTVLQGWQHGAHAHIRLRHLLDHSAGFPAHLRLWERVRGRAEYESALRSVPLERHPGEASVYSDIGFMVLGLTLETVRGCSLDDQFTALRTAWAGTSLFNPPPGLRPRIAPTEYDASTRTVVHGEVHDENARALGGVAGHAGLFGTAGDVGAFARLVLRTFQQPTVLGDPGLMRMFATPSGVASSSRALGWDTMRPTSSCGTLMSADAIGHTGFTGTSLWIDHARDLYVVLLMNRVHPTRANDAHIALRPLVHDAIVSAFDRRP